MVELYGGAVSTKIPAGAIDVATMRPVPDTQEVFIVTDGDRDIYIIFDLLESVKAAELVKAMEEHIEDVFGLVNFEVLEQKRLKVLDAEVCSVMLEQGQFVSLVGLLRLEKVRTDVLVTLNIRGTSLEEARSRYFAILDEASSHYKVEDWGLFG